MAASGNADGVLVHAPTSEQKYIDQGDLIDRQLIMHNDFVLVGPKSDPAGVKGSADIKAAMTAIAKGGGFISRGDNSGTNTKELQLWAAASIDPATVAEREESGQGMGATLNIADQKQAYTLSDRGTYLALKSQLSLDIVFEGDPTLLNVYHAYVVNPDKHSGVKLAQAKAWVDFLVAPSTQQIIADFGKDKYGSPLFFADAGKDETKLGVKP
jgi:tungstate transport system substrate-binding protein